MTHLLGGVGDALSHARLALWPWPSPLHVAGLLITGERWRVVIAALGTRLPLMRITLINLASIFIRNTTPTTGIGGDASRIALLGVEGMPLDRATAAFAYVRLAEIPQLALSVLLALPAIAGGARRSRTSLTIAAVGVGLAIVAAWVYRGRIRARLAVVAAAFDLPLTM